MEIDFQIFSTKPMEFSFPQNLWKMWISSIRLKCSGILFSMEFIKKIHKIEGIQFSTEFVKNVNFVYSIKFVEFLSLSWKLWFHCRFRWIGNGIHISTFFTNLKNLIPQFSTEFVYSCIPWNLWKIFSLIDEFSTYWISWKNYFSEIPIIDELIPRYCRIGRIKEIRWR